MDKKRFNESIELCKHFYESNSGQFVAEPGKTRECFANSVNITLKIDQNSIPIFTKVHPISADQLKFDFHFPSSIYTTQSAQINISTLNEGNLISLNAYNSSIHVEVAKTFGNGSKLIYWYLDGSKKIYGRFIANPIPSNNSYL